MSEEVQQSVALSELPVDELVVYGRRLGLHLDDKTPQGELLRRIRERQELLVELDRDAMLDIVVWARRPVRQSISKEELAREIAGIRKDELKTLSDRGLYALARLRGVKMKPGDTRAALESRIRAQEPLWEMLQRKRRKWVGTLVSKMLDEPEPPEQEYKFLPEEKVPPATLKDQIVEQGIVGGIARRLRGVADDYVREKLDEIEARIDRKLDEIDRRLAEWRDQEIANRLRIIKITLVASVIVAVVSLLYSYVVALFNH